MRSCGKAIKASDGEVDANVRSRSAIMRVAEKIS
jgi:16S rRNA (cytosine1402-N4)-methyltransferase